MRRISLLEIEWDADDSNVFCSPSNFINFNLFDFSLAYISNQNNYLFIVFYHFHAPRSTARIKRKNRAPYFTH